MIWEIFAYMRNPLASKLAEAQAALALAESKIKEQREVMFDLLPLLGSRMTCARCGIPVFWIVVRNGSAYSFNPDGTQHWPRCPGAERPLEAAAGE